MSIPPPVPAQGRPEADGARLCEAVIASAGDAILAVDRDGRITLWNAGCEQLFGWRAEEMLGQDAARLVPEDDRDELARVLRALSGAAEPAALETMRLQKSGAQLPVSCRLSPVRGADGELIGACAVVRDNGREIELRRELERTRHLAEARFLQSVVPQVTLSPAGVLLDVNPAFCRLTGRPANQLIGQPAASLVADPAVAAWALEMVADGQRIDSQQAELRHEDGRLIETRVSMFALRDDDTGQIVRLEAVIEDVSAAAAVRRELALREARWHSLAVNSADVALLCGPDGELLFVSDAVVARFGYRPEDLLHADGFSFVHPEDEPGARAILASTLAGGFGTTAVFELRVLHADGSWHWVEQSLTNRLDDPAVGAMVVNITDITDLKSAEAVLEELAGADTLTGLPTRTPLMAALDAAFAAQRGARTAVGVLDLARFKLVNDTHGHRGGDRVLTEIARRIVDHLGERGIAARTGGDRFAFLLRDVADITDLFEAVGELICAVEQPLSLNGQPVSVTARVGAALGPAVESGALLTSAEHALQSARTGLTGPMHVVRAESSSAAVFHARQIEDLRRGLDAGELAVHFQPIVTVGDGVPVAAEALVRWNHPENGLLPAGAFMDAAEDSGLIIEVGQQVLLEACRAAARWADLGTARAPFRVAVNLSTKQLTRGDIVATVRAALAATGASAANLMLEVTETAVMSDVDAAVRALQELRALGVSVAVDDFGTGYSSLTYLKQFPLTTLKIDRSFVAGLGVDSDDAAIVSSVISLAGAMQLDCVAEGVETDQQRLVLQALGCTYAQGHLWSAALDALSLEAWLGSARRSREAVAAPAAPQPRAGSADEDVALHRIREMSAAGASLNTIAAALNGEHLLAPHGRRWTSRAIALMMADRRL